MQAMSSTLTSDQPLRVLNTTLRERLQLVNSATRALATKGVRVIGQDLDAPKRPVLFVDQAPAREAGLMKLSHLTTRGDGKLVQVSRFLDVDVAWPAERVS